LALTGETETPIEDSYQKGRSPMASTITAVYLEPSESVTSAVQPPTSAKPVAQNPEEDTVTFSTDTQVNQLNKSGASPAQIAQSLGISVDLVDLDLGIVPTITSASSSSAQPAATPAPASSASNTTSTQASPGTAANNTAATSTTASSAGSASTAAATAAATPASTPATLQASATPTTTNVFG